MLALDQATGLLTLKQPGSTPFNSNLRILRIQDVQVIIVSLGWHGRALAAYVHAAMVQQKCSQLVHWMAELHPCCQLTCGCCLPMQSVSSVAPGASNNGKLPYIDPQRCKDREERAVAVRTLHTCYCTTTSAHQHIMSVALELYIAGRY